MPGLAIGSKYRLLWSCFGIVMLLLALPLHGRGENPVAWSAASRDLGGGLHEVTFTARITAPWHIYDMGPYELGGPNATAFAFGPSAEFELVGGVEPQKKPTRVDDPFMGELGYYAGQVRFVQRVRLKEDGAALRATVEWMACNDQSCLPPEETELAVTLTGSVVAAAGERSSRQGESGRTGTSGAVSVASGPETAVEIAGPKETERVADGARLVEPVGSDSAGVILAGKTEGADRKPAESSEDNVSADTGKAGGGRSIWGVIAEAILWGFAALLTPCVFPMVPMTVSFFLKGSENKARGRFRAMMYGLSIVALYTVPIAVIIAVTRWIGGDAVTADIFNWLATHWIPNVIFFLVFMVFAASFFGAFEITMPAGS